MDQVVADAWDACRLLHSTADLRVGYAEGKLDFLLATLERLAQVTLKEFAQLVSHEAL